MKQPKVYVKSLDRVFEVEFINFNIKGVEVYDENYYVGPFFYYDEVIFIYNTGYKDKSGNYIFTGDIVVHNSLKYVVRKKTEEEFYYLEKNGKYYCRLSSMEDDYSVIGNIYENKELLEVR